jgi:hypothetical protein
MDGILVVPVYVVLVEGKVPLFPKLLFEWIERKPFAMNLAKVKATSVEGSGL